MPEVEIPGTLIVKTRGGKYIMLFRCEMGLLQLGSSAGVPDCVKRLLKEAEA